METDVSHWSVQDVSQWLCVNNLSQHAQIFQNNDIDGTVLLQLDQPVLKEMGMSSMGDRLRLLAAVRTLSRRSPSVSQAAQMPARAASSKSMLGGPKLSPLNLFGGRYGDANGADEHARHADHSPSVRTPTCMPDGTFLLSPKSPAFSKPHPTSRRPNTATGISPRARPGSSGTNTSSYIGTPSTAMQPKHRRPATANSASSQVGYSVGRGAFAASAAAKQRVAAISAPYNLRRNGSGSDSDSRGDPLTPCTPSSVKSMRRPLIKFVMRDGAHHVVDVGDSCDPSDILARILQAFGIEEAGLPTYTQPWAIAMNGMDGKPKMLSENELLTVCRAPHTFLPVTQHGLLLDFAEHFDTGGVTKRASTVSILSGLGVDNASQALLPVHLLHTARTAVAASEPLLPVVTVRRKVRNFFGQRPPSELISSHLAEYFPKTDSCELQRHSQGSIKRKERYADRAHEGARATIRALPTASVPPPQSAPAVVLTSTTETFFPYRDTAKDDDRASLVTVDEITLDLEERNALAADKGESSKVDQDGMPVPLSSSLRTASAVSPAFCAPTAPPKRDVPLRPVKSSMRVEEVPRMRWHKGALIGAGSYGNVFLGMNAKTGMLMAVKQVELPTNEEETTKRRKLMVESLESEITLLKTIQHPNIVHYLDSFPDGEFLNIFLEYVPGGSVVSLLRNYGPFEEQLVQNFIRQILQGLSFLHAREIVHRDIKGANILVDNKGGVKISDFGISKKVESGLLNATGNRDALQGSVYWMAPEVVKQTMYTPKADIWSVGCLVVEMLTAEHPWANLDQMQALFKIGMGKPPEIPEDVSVSAIAFLRAIFEIDFQQRPTADALLAHPFANPAEEEGLSAL
ncbi:mitogen-activated protein kinase kinase kinase [Malassezia vespertilionis]|uniref:mitogen-activated protein kinase kinase kinase n=1 Tax=Malassezia vespertilionis TaxID=2020962 RepID=A0A2N1J850_9BASI|nr:mitogen-activated protein kinase kinase kinase [Malassezia vespertilionis]PKI82734.1 Ste11p [Malassezia vespertilionis]WFD08567.1 mitogen-activated protein kinase kinase kinase [Malassezia vespertilionis]